MNKLKAGMISLGCPKNLVDGEAMLWQLSKEYEITTDENKADIIVINTCGFIDSAKQESINAILEAVDRKGLQNGQACKAVIVTGCLAKRYGHDIMADIPEVDAVIGTENLNDILEACRNSLLTKTSGEELTNSEDGMKNLDDAQESCRNLSLTKASGSIYLNNVKGSFRYSFDAINEGRLISTGKYYAYLKIAEGCDNRCSYCAIPLIRGGFVSRKEEDILEEARRLSDQGIKELILVSQDSTGYGEDLYGKRTAAKLLENLSRQDGIERIRILYSYPDKIDEELLSIMAQNDKICKYIDMPIQHASDRILKKMDRRGGKELLYEKVALIRKIIPGVVLRTSVITGFPGETDEDFDILYDFVAQIRFERLGVFCYSREEGTKAYREKPLIGKKLSSERRDIIMELQHDISLEFNKSRVGKACSVSVEGVSGDGIFYTGRSFAESPDIDGNIYFTSKKPLQFGTSENIIILDCNEYDLIGEVITGESRL